MFKVGDVGDNGGVLSVLSCRDGRCRWEVAMGIRSFLSRTRSSSRLLHLELEAIAFGMVLM